MIESFLELADLFPNAITSGIIMSIACSLIGVYVVLKRVVFISIALSETAACGIAAAMLLNIHPLIGSVALTVMVVMLLSVNYEMSRIPRDAVLGVVFLLAAGLSILLVSKSGFGLHEIRAMLYGDLILAGSHDRNVLLVAITPALIFFLCFLRPITYTFLDRDASQVMGLSCRLWEISFFLVLGLVVSAASKNGGALLVFCYLVAMPATALLLTRRLAAVFVISLVVAIMSTLSGMTLSHHHDLPTNQTIIVLSCVVFAAAFMLRGLVLRLEARGVRLGNNNSNDK